MLSKEVILFNPNSLPEMVSGRFTGNNLTLSASDDLKWEIAQGSKYIQMTPSNGLGATVQLAPVKGDYTGGPETVIINVTDDIKRTDRNRMLVIYISELSNSFIFDRHNIDLQPGGVEVLQSSIAGGTNSSYEEINWYVTNDYLNPNLEVVRLFGKGKSIQVMGINDGSVDVVGIYRGQIEKCAVTVKSPTYFRIAYNSFRMYPGERTREGKLLEIPFFVRPTDANIRWYSTNSSSDPALEYNIYEPAAAKELKGSENTLKGDIIKL
jgi:hypothetical protein